MIRAIALPVMFLTSAMMALAADQSSNSDEPGEFDIEPPILKQNLSDELAEAGSRVTSGEATKQELEVAKTALAQLIEAEQKAVAKRESAELEFAEANLRRQQRLLTLGSAHKSDVTNAEEKLAELKGPKN